jgi:hypothetical protein
VIAAFPVGWAPRERPLRPVGVVASGRVAEALVERLLAQQDRGEWRGVGGVGWVVVLGEGPPWIDGGLFLGVDPAAPRLLLPTHSAPVVEGAPVARWLEGLVAARCVGRPGPYAVAPALGILPVGAARALHPDGLGRWRAR